MRCSGVRVHRCYEERLEAQRREQIHVVERFRELRLFGAAFVYGGEQFAHLALGQDEWQFFLRLR